MGRRSVLILVVVAVVVAILAPTASAARTSSFQVATALPSSGAAQSAPARSYLPLNAAALTQAKALAEEKSAGNTAGRFGPSIGGIGSSPTPTTAWEGVYQTNVTPPDTTGAVSTNRYIELINLQFGIYNRDGTLASGSGANGTLGNLIGSNPFNHPSKNKLSDPQILYDPYTKLFYYVVLDYGDDTFAFGFSKSDAPTTTADFCRYWADWGYGSDLPDYPKLGDTQGNLLIGANIFSNGIFYTGSDLLSISKPTVSAPISSCPAPSFTLGRHAGISSATPVPAVQTDPSATGYVTVADDPRTGTANTIRVIPVIDGSGAPTLGTAKNVTVPSYSVPSNAKEQGSSATLDTLDGRLERAVSAVDPLHGNRVAVWTAHAVFGGAGAQERWYEIDAAVSPASSLLQSGTVSDSQLWVWNGAISPDRVVNTTGGTAFGGNMVMGISTSGQNAYPAIQMVSKTGSNAQTAMSLVKQSPGPDFDYSCTDILGNPRPCRWGDYSGASPDPAADTSGNTGTVWLANQWNVASVDNTTDWRTYIWSATPGGGGSQPTAPGAPTMNAPTAGDATVHLSWSPPASDGGSTITNYKVYKGTSSNGEVLLTTLGNVTSFDDNAVTNGTPYFYKVSAVNGVGEGTQSNEVTATPSGGGGVTAPAAPQSLTAKGFKGGVKLAWQAPLSDGGSAITGYKIFRGTASGAEGTTPIATPTGTSFNDTSAIRGQTYWYYVKATNAVGDSPASNEAFATRPTRTVL